MTTILIWALALTIFLFGWLLRGWVDSNRELFRTTPKPVRPRKPRAYLTPRSAKLLVVGLLLAGACGAQGAWHAEPSLAFTGRLRMAPGLTISRVYDNVQFQGIYQWERRHGHMAAAAGGIRLYTTATEVSGWLLVGPSYTWYSAEARNSGEAVRNGLTVLVGMRFDYGRSTLQLDYNLNTLSARFTFPLFNHQ